jgi:hypothetical protein|tara:strand:+ start:213 stop:482 length:270 start_codon:yes stop_codon:yes gene_type:complete
MFKKKPKAPSRKAPYLAQTEDNIKHWSWAMKNGISMCVVPNWSLSDKWNIEITINDRVSKDPVDYKGVEALAKMFEYYKYYYDKHENKV